MTTARVYTFVTEPSGATYVSLLRCAFSRGDRFSLVQRRSVAMAATALETLRLLEPSLLDQRMTADWPGTRLVGDKALLREYRCTDASRKVLESAVAGLYEWTQPAQPEDLVVSTRGEPWLVSIAHERDAQLRLTPEDMSNLQEQAPEVARILVADVGNR
jgi:hypothetical protein